MYSRRKEDPHRILSGGEIFVDHDSGFVRVYSQVSLGVADSICSKELFEHHASKVEVTIKQYHGNNGVYKSKLFTKDLDRLHQTITYSRVGAHY